MFTEQKNHFDEERKRFTEAAAKFSYEVSREGFVWLRMGKF